MGTTIFSNGSKWAGQSPDTIEQLCEVLRTEPLDRRFTREAFYWQEDDGAWWFFGNFQRVSHVFNICTTDDEIAAKLRAEIDENMRRPDFLSQEVPKWDGPALRARDHYA